MLNILGKPQCLTIMAVIASVAVPAHATIIIDNFNIDHSVNLSGTPPQYTAGSTVSDGITNNIVGDFRNISLLKTAGSRLSDIRGLADSDGGLFSLSTGAGVTGKALLSYTGTAGLGSGFTGNTFNPPSMFNLGGGVGIDITEGGANKAIRVRASADNVGLPLIFTLYSSATNYVRYSVIIPGGDIDVLNEYTLMFSNFTVTGGLSLDQVLQAVRAITVEVNAHPNGFPTSVSTDAQLDYIIASPIPEPGTYSLMGLALIGLGALRRRFRR